MRQLSDAQPAVESFLSVLGAGNWGGPSYRAQEGSEEPTLITRYLSKFFSRLAATISKLIQQLLC